MDSNSKQACSNKFVTFNCKSLKRSLDNVRDICKFADVLALQETWLLPHDVHLLNTIHKDFEYTGKSAVDTSAGILKGRPYGGVAILWRKGLFKTVSVINCNSDRLAAIRATLSDNRSVIIFSVYLPTDNSENLLEFTNCLGEISAIVENNDTETIFMLGDFNSHPYQPFWTELCSHCRDNQWICADVEKLGIDSDVFTYISDINGSQRWLDHCIVTTSAWHTVTYVNVDLDTYWSDHLPLIIECDLNIIVSKVAQETKSQSKVLWRERNRVEIDRYRDLCNEELRNIHYPELLEKCGDSMCQNVEHRRALDRMYGNIVNTLSVAAEQAWDDKQPQKVRRVAGWNKHVRCAHGEARSKYQTWLFYNKPKSGRIWEEMRQSQKIFRGRLKWCQNHQDQIKMDILASHQASKNFSEFWKSTSKLKVGPGRPVSVGECSSPEDIAHMFKERFMVSSPLGPAREVIDDETSRDYEPMRFSGKRVAEIIKGMAKGKSPGHDGLSIEHLKCAGVHLPRVLALFFTLCISHSYLPPEMLKTIVVPIVKNKTGDMSDKANYRPISLATVIAKVLDGLLDKELDKWISLHDAQFGFRPGLSTESAILCLKQTVQYYKERGTPVYACFLDLSKAFDLVSYDVLWGKLEGAGVPPELTGLFQYWYSNQLNQVRWGDVLSEAYRLECGVRQGGLTSPKLFNLYVNELVVELSNMPVGCKIDGTSINNISYADDMVLLGPTAGSIREMLSVCERYAAAHGLLYNEMKSEYLVFVAPGKHFNYEPSISLNGRPLKRVTQFKYLGHYVTEDLKDQVDIERERRALAARCNMLAHRFARCSNEVKTTLFKAYCQTFYTGSLWVSCTRRALDALRVQYNNGFRVLLRLPRFCSASGMFASERTDDFFAIRRKKTASLISRMRASTNSILKTLADKHDAPIFRHAVRLLVRQGE